MAGIPNQDIPFERLSPFAVYRATVNAPNSRWQMEVMGQQEFVERFVRESRFRIEVVPLAEIAQSSQRQAMAQNQAVVKRRKTRARNNLAPDAVVDRGVQFGVTLRLVESTLSKPNAVRFVIDPMIMQASSPHAYWLYLPEDTDAPIIICTPTRGSVTLSLYGAGNFWSAYVYWQAGEPAEYTLRGDIVRF